MENNDNLRLEKLALLIGSVVGQINELLNQIQKEKISYEYIYKSLLDINKAAALHIHELYYKDSK